MAYRDIVLADTPLDYYEMNTLTGTDSGSGARTATLANITNGGGVQGNGWAFNGLNSQATMGTFPSITTNFSFEVWVKAPSAQGWTNEYPTFIRRDGSDIVLIRGRGSNLGVSPGEIDVYLSGTSFQGGSAYRIDDGKWHHIVLTVAGSSALLYLDGRLIKTQGLGKSTHNFGTGSAYIGGNAGLGAEFYQGTLDELSIYNTTLTAQKVTNHYNQGLSVLETSTVTEDSFVSSQAGGTSTNYGTNANLLVASSLVSYIKLPSNPDAVSGRLRLRRSFTRAAGPITISTVSADWSEGTITWSNKPATSNALVIQDPGGAAGTDLYIDLPAPYFNSTYGIAITTTGTQGNFHSSNATSVDDRPVFEALGYGSPDVTYMATPMTATASMPNAVISRSTTYSASPMTASATSPDAVVGGGTNIAVARGGYPDGTFEAAAVSIPQLSENDGLFLDFELPADFDPNFIVSAKLKFTGSPTGNSPASDHYRVRRVVNPWSVGTDYHAVDGTYTGEVNYTKTNNQPAAVSIDVTSLMTVKNENFHGFRITSDDLSSIQGAGRTLELVYVSVIIDATYVADPMTGSAVMPDATVFLNRDATLLASAMTAEATMPAAFVEAQHDGLFVAEAMIADATMPGGSFSYPATFVAEPMTADASSPDAVISTTVGVKYVASPMTATAKWVPPANVNGVPIDQNENEDPYYNRVTALKPKAWWRFMDGGESVKDTVSGTLTAGVYRGGAIANQATAPEGRKAVHFPLGAYIEQNEPTGTNADETTYIGNNSIVRTVLEFSIKTTKANQFVMAGADQTVGANGVASTAGATEVFIKNGTLGYRTWSNQTLNQQGLNDIVKEFNGFKNVADGEWHHIAIRSGIKSGVRDEYGVEIWVDGKMDVRRYFTQSWIGFPDFVGARFANFDSARLPVLPLAQYFEGDLAELVWYADTANTEDDVTRNYYAFMGYRPFAAPAMEATATMPDAKAKGNQKKALYLYWSDQDEVFGGMPSKAGQTRQESVSFDPMPNLAGGSYQAPGFPRMNEETGEFFGFKVFTKSITRNYSPIGVIPYRDRVTDEQSLIDLTRDVDLSDYDVIMFKDWPDEGYEIDTYEANYPGQRERLLQQLREANSNGVGLYVTNPRLAIDLGIIDRVEWVEPLTESKFIGGQGRAEGLYDYGSALKFPWNIVSSDGLTGNPFAAGIGQPANTSPEYLSSKAYFYYDNNRNNKFRVVAKVDGLTDLPSYMLEDAVFHVDADQFGWEGVAYKYLHRENGLQIGDEYIFNGAPTVDGRWLDMVEQRYTRGNGAFATPPGHVKAGTVVTTFGSKHFVNGVETTNPYQNHATTIVLESGTILNGQSTGGRIFVNFTETPSQGLGLPVQVLPGSQDALDNPFGLEPELDTDAPVFVINGTPEQKALTEAALARCTFPFERLQARIKAKFGNPTFPIVWEDIDPGERSGGAGVFIPHEGVIRIDQALLEEFVAQSGQNYEDAAMETIIHELAHLVDYIYLQPYQRVNIWNVFHEDWNVWHGWEPKEDFLLPEGYPMDMTTVNIHMGEGWGNAGSYVTDRMAEAFAQAFVQAYSDIPVDVFAMTSRTRGQTYGHPAPESIGPKIRAAIEVGQGAYLFNQSQVESGWPAGYNEETPAQREWEYSWTRTSLSFSAAALKTRTVNVTLPDGSIQSIVQGSTIATRGDLPLSMVRSNQLFPVISKPRLEMTARGIYWLADEDQPAAGDVTVRAEPMTANATAPSATAIAERSNAYVASAMTANAMMPEAEQAKSGDVLYLAFPMTATGRMSQGSERTFKAEPMTATAMMPDAVNKFEGEAITLRLPRPQKITLRIKEAV